MTAGRKVRLGVDVGGTFTDAMLIDEENGRIQVAKVPSTRDAPSRGFLAATDRVFAFEALSPSDITYVMHGSTVATNAIIEGKGARIGLILTAGFGDLMEIQRQVRPVLYDLQFEKPTPLVPRNLCFEVRERVNSDGEVETSLVEEDVFDAIALLRHRKITSVAVCLLHSYLNSAHEQRVGDILRREYPDALVSLSCVVCPEFREYFRASTTAINAIIRPVVSGYLGKLEEELRSRKVSAELLVMQSNGGVLPFEVASEQPVYTVESGPAAGVIAATYIGNALGETNVLSFDMGGTTAKAGMVRDGQPHVTKEFEVGAIARSGGVGPTQATGYPIRTPVIDLVEIGAGGGSLAWVDSGGILRVGPQSAGADPGPVCYGGGGTEPTVTDANLVLGRLNPEYFLGGEMPLDVGAAREAITERCARPLGLEINSVAHGIIEIANTAMTNALGIVSIQRGHDPRDFSLIAFGGAGPAHASRLGEELGVRMTVIPMSPGLATAMGLLATDLKRDYSVTRIMRTDQLDLTTVNMIYEDLAKRGASMLAGARVSPSRIRIVRQIEMRYVGQSYELTVLVPECESVTDDVVCRIIQQFHIEHDRAYGRAAPDQPVEFVNFRLTAVGKIAELRLRELETNGTRVDEAVKANRGVYFAEAGGFVSTVIYDRYRLQPDHELAGPAIIEEMDSTTVIHPGYKAHVDGFGNIVIKKTSST